MTDKDYSVHIDVGLEHPGTPVILLCGAVWKSVRGHATFEHVADVHLLENATCQECKNHPDLPIHQLKYTELED